MFVIVGVFVCWCVCVFVFLCFGVLVCWCVCVLVCLCVISLYTDRDLKMTLCCRDSRKWEEQFRPIYRLHLIIGGSD